jgi:hypothetical protein
MRNLWPAVTVAILVVWSVLGTWLAIGILPGILEPPVDFREEDPFVTWVGMGTAAAYGFGILLFVGIYAAKRWIVRWASSVAAAIGWYGLAVATSLPYIWFLVVLDWQNPHVFRIACWVYYPLGIWAVPTFSFAWDMTHRSLELTKAWYFARSMMELVLIIPVWLMVWVFVSFFFLCGGWI